MKFFLRVQVIVLILFISSKTQSQNCNSINIQLKADIASACSTMVMTMIHDERPGMPYLYVANKEGGLKIYDITNISAPSLIYTIPTSRFSNLDVMSLTQSGEYLYLAIGNTFTNPQQGGVQIVKITNPTAPVLYNSWLVPGSSSGAGVVKVEGNYLYLGAMKSGLVILDITDKANILYLSRYMPDINWPVNNPNANLYNARGMEVKNSIVYLCFDAGGLRIINCTNKLSPRETGHFANSALYNPLNLPRAYNNLVLDDSLVYVAVDYCGMEVISVKDTGNMKLIGWWNPYNCPNNNWFSSPVHANEIQYVKACKYAFLSTGKSDMMVINLANPSHPDSCNYYGGVTNGIGTWGVGTYADQIYLSYICSVVPFTSGWTGLKILSYTPCVNGINEITNSTFSVYPNPAESTLNINCSNYNSVFKFKIYTFLGKLIFEGEINSTTTEIDVSRWDSGLYILQTGGYSFKFIKR